MIDPPAQPFMKTYCENCKRKVTAFRRLARSGALKRFSDNRHTLCTRCHRDLRESEIQREKFGCQTTGPGNLRTEISLTDQIKADKGFFEDKNRR